MQVGSCYLIFTVQFFYAGRVVGFRNGGVILAPNSHQIFDTGDLRQTAQSLAWADHRQQPRGGEIPLAMVTGTEELPDVAACDRAWPEKRVAVDAGARARNGRKVKGGAE